MQLKPCPKFLAPISGAKSFPTNPVFSQFERDNGASLFVWRKKGLILWRGDNLHLITHMGLTPQMPFPISDKCSGACSNVENESSTGIGKYRLCLGQGAFLEAYCSHQPQLAQPWWSGNLTVQWAASPEADILLPWEWTGKRGPGQACTNSPPS